MMRLVLRCFLGVLVFVALQVVLAGIAGAALPSVSAATACADARDYDSLEAAVTAAVGMTLLISNEQVLRDDLVIPRTVAITIMKGGMIVRRAPAKLTINGAFDAGMYQVFEGFESGGLRFGPGSISEIYPQWFGAAGDGTTDDSEAFNALAASLPPYGAIYNNYANGVYPTIKIPQGNYALATTWNLSFRNDLVIYADGSLKWIGTDDGTMIELKCSSRTKTYNLKLDGNRKAGTFIHQSGDGTSDAKPGKNRLAGKGNVANVIHSNFYLHSQYPQSKKAMFDTIPYPEDTPHRYYYSMDDSTFYSPVWRTGGSYGFCLSIGSSAIAVYHPLMVAPNGIILYSGTISLYSPVFSLQANDKGAIYAVANTYLGDIALYSPYMEHTTKPFFSMDPASTKGSIGHVHIQGGLFSQLSGATRIIDIPPSVAGHIVVNDPKVQSPHGRKIYAPSCSVQLTGTSLGPKYRDYGLEIEKTK